MDTRTIQTTTQKNRNDREGHYVVDCLCGQHIESREPRVTCGNCGRELVIEWPGKYKENPKATISTEI